MRITTAKVRFTRRRNLGNYEHSEASVEFEIVVEEEGSLTDDQVAEALKEAKVLVWRALREKEDRT